MLRNTHTAACAGRYECKDTASFLSGGDTSFLIEAFKGTVADFFRKDALTDPVGKLDGEGRRDRRDSSGSSGFSGVEGSGSEGADGGGPGGSDEVVNDDDGTFANDASLLGGDWCVAFKWALPVFDQLRPRKWRLLIP
jgi:hypothetical protein